MVAVADRRSTFQSMCMVDPYRVTINPQIKEAPMHEASGSLMTSNQASDW